jgi:hypothetical protein
VAIGSGVVSAGKAAIAVSTLTGGTHSITAVYSGDAANGGSTSAALAQVVDKAAATATVSSSADPAAVGQAVTFTATVTPAGATGPVQFLDGGTVIATVQLGGGTAAFTTSGLAAGAHKISAQYLGDGNFNPDVSPAFTQNVNKAK